MSSPPAATAAGSARLPWYGGSVAALGGRLLEGLMATCRYGTDGEIHYHAIRHGGGPAVYLVWHGRLLVPTYHHRREGIGTLVSLHRDGEYIARVVRRWGYTVVRGSSSRGGRAALADLVRQVRDGRSLALMPDGPRGPFQRMKAGPILIAQRTGAPLLPVGAGADRAWWFGSWDRFLVPKPFARVRIVYGEPIHVPRDLGGEPMERWIERVEAAMAGVMERADR
jgi:lysophospholipid acyltransferase (LPLAT)-like uncharacterized protein